MSGAGTQLQQAARILTALETILAEERPDVVVVSGDTTTTLAGALAAVKGGFPLAHVEAGLRSFDRSMPEEQNRVVTDHLSDLLLCPTDQAVENLAREAITSGVHQVGDVMYDACLTFRPLAVRRGAMTARDGSPWLPPRDGPPRRGNRQRGPGGAGGSPRVAGPAVFPIHPRTRARLEGVGMLERVARIPGLALVPPVGYLDFASLLVSARAVLTDSGGVQKEAYFHGVPCITLRERTEWVETVTGGFNRLTGMDPVRVRGAGRPADAGGSPALLRRRSGRRRDR